MKRLPHKHKMTRTNHQNNLLGHYGTSQEQLEIPFIFICSNNMNVCANMSNIVKLVYTTLYQLVTFLAFG